MPKGKVCVTFAKWAKEYGPVFYLHGMGTSGTLVLNTYEAASDLLDKRGGLYSDREKVYHSRDLSGRGGAKSFPLSNFALTFSCQVRKLAQCS